MASLTDKIEELIEQEVKKQVQEALSNYADMISKSYKIPLSLLLRDIPNVVPREADVTSTTCLGLRAGNKRCKMNGKYEGYCRHHFVQKQKTQPIMITQGEIKHTHGFPPMYQEGCPACAPRPIEPKKPLIDFKLVL
jgi:hypothetical protein